MCYFIPHAFLQTLIKIGQTIFCSLLDDSIPSHFLKEKPWLFSQALDAHSRLVVIYALTEFSGWVNECSKKLQVRLDWIEQNERHLFHFCFKYLGFSSLQEHNILVVPKSVKKALELKINEVCYSVPWKHFPGLFHSSDRVTF